VQSAPSEVYVIGLDLLQSGRPRTRQLCAVSDEFGERQIQFRERQSSRKPVVNGFVYIAFDEARAKAKAWPGMRAFFEDVVDGVASDDRGLERSTAVKALT
jgi:hypothetical protein